MVDGMAEESRLLKAVVQTPCRDVLDESDQLLHNRQAVDIHSHNTANLCDGMCWGFGVDICIVGGRRFQLIYAMGAQMGLPSGCGRQDAVQAVLCTLSKHAFSSSSTIGEALGAEGVSTWAQPK